MTTEFAPGLHVRPGLAVETDAYDQWVGRWSRLFVPLVVGAAVQPGDQVLDVSTGTGEAAAAIMPVVGASGRVIGVDLAPAMLESARARLHERTFLAVAADGQALPFPDATFDAVVCQLGLQFFPNPALGLAEFRRVLRNGGSAGICVISTPDRAPCGAYSLMCSVAFSRSSGPPSSCPSRSPTRPDWKTCSSAPGFRMFTLNDKRATAVSIALNSIGNRSRRAPGLSLRFT
jgi:SAM-dependent methyltransferase